MIGSNGLLEWVAAEAAPHSILWNCAVDIFFFGLTVKCSDHGHSFCAGGRKVERGFGRGGLSMGWGGEVGWEVL